MPKSSRSTPRSRPTGGDSPTFRFERRNLVLIAGGVVAVMGGFHLLSRGSTVAAPILLIVGFLVLIPWGVISGTFRSR